ncbi:MAG: aromatic acid exporter family protein [Peptoniphilus sp.]|nr:aromatic acid exporter family protein [Peptoniphilus sp.]
MKKIKDLNLKKRIGMRTVKTSLAVTVSLYLSMFFNLNTPIFTAIAAITTMKASISESFADVRKRIFTAIFGVMLGYIFSTIPIEQIYSPLLAGLGIIIIIYSLQIFNMKSMISLSCIVFIASYTTKSGSLNYGINRVLGTFLGIVVSVVINFLISMPNIFESFIIEAKEVSENFKKLLVQFIVAEKHSMDSMEKSYAKLLKTYNTLISEQKTPGHVEQDFVSAKEIINTFEDINRRFQILKSVEYRPQVLNANKKTIENYLHLKILQPGNLEGDLNSICNFHIMEIIAQLSAVDKLIGEYDYE